MASAERLAHPVFRSSPVLKDATPRALLSWGSDLLHGTPFVSARDLSVAGTSPGVLRPFSALGRESPRPAVARRVATSCPVATRRLADEHLQLPRGCWQVPCCQLRCRSQVFPTSQQLLPLSAVLPCFRQMALLGFMPFRGLLLPRSPGGSSPPVYLHDVAPADWPRFPS